MKLKRITAFLTAMFMLCSVSACVSTEPDAENASAPAENKTIESISASAEQSGSLSIKRSVRTQNVPMGEPGTWTVFVYLCGSNLESDDYLASTDIEEMMASSANENIRFVVQTGGANDWYYDNIHPDTAQRWVIQDGEMTEVWSENAVSMGESQSLSDFLRWGVAEYPAANMGLVLWNHGSGSINGVCFDETAEDDALLLKEMDAALYSVYDNMTQPFSFIGFDACLMSAAETAAILATHADFMIASQELEPGYGWDYTTMGNYLAQHPECDGSEIGKVICDSFYEGCREIGEENSATLSVIDLRKMDALLTSFDAYAKELYEMTEHDADFSEIARKISAADNFGGNNRASGYTNMVDLAGLIDAGKSKCSSAQTALQALSDAVVYQVKGSDHTDSCGLSIYYPLQVQEGSQELRIFKDVCLSSYYLGLVDKIAYGAVHSGSISDYNNSSVLELFSNEWSADAYESSDNNATLNYLLNLDSQWDYADDFTAGADSDITFIDEPAFDEDGNYWFSLSEDSLYQTDYVEAAVYLLDEESEEMIELGLTGEIYEDWEEGVFSDNFDGFWFCLPDDQYLAAYLYEECDGYDLYISPILLNGEETYLRFAYDEENVETAIVDIWNGQDESGAASRITTQLQPGDIITPLYTAYDLNSDDSYYYYGEEYEYDGDPSLYFEVLPDGDYLYSFCINDIYGNYYQTDPVAFSIEDEEIYFDTF